MCEVREIVIDLNKSPPAAVYAGRIGEHYASVLVLTPPPALACAAAFRAAFSVGGVLHRFAVLTGETFRVPIRHEVTLERYALFNLEAYGENGEYLRKSKTVRLKFLEAADGEEPSGEVPPWGGGVPGGDAGDYNALDNKPAINGVTLAGDKSGEELGFEALTNTEIEAILSA